MGPSGGKRRQAPAGAGREGAACPPEAGPVEAPAVLREGAASDAGRAADLHAAQIAEGFLSFLGPRFLARLYRRVVRSPESFLLVAEERGTVVGFIAGTADVGRLYRSFLWHDGLGAGIDAGARLVRRWRQALETLRHGSGQRVGTGDGVELLAVAVDPAVRGRGVGELLVTGFLDRVRRRGGDAAYVVVAADNEGAVRLYRRAGFETRSSVEIHAGVASLVMQWHGEDAPGGSGGGTEGTGAGGTGGRP